MAVLTVKLLRAKLDELEANWTSEDDKYFGSFEDTTIMTDGYRKHDSIEHSFVYGGVSHSKIEVDYTLGIIITQEENCLGSK